LKVGKKHETDCKIDDDSMQESKEAGPSSTNLKHSYDKSSGVAIDLNATEIE
jgi:hypothetical protein